MNAFKDVNKEVTQKLPVSRICIPHLLPHLKYVLEMT